MKRKIKKIFDVVQPYTMIYISFESSQRDLQVEHGQFENLKFVQFRKIKLFFTNPMDANESARQADSNDTMPDS